MICEVLDQDRLSRELLIEFINKTPGLSLKKKTRDATDIVFIDIDDSSYDETNGVETVVVSSDKKHVHSLFKNQIADYLYKPDLSYSRFLAAVENVKQRLDSKSMT